MAETTQSSTDESKTRKLFFTDLSPRFPKVREDGKIDALQFIEASRSYATIYDLFGSTFFVLKRDILGNVEKLTKVYNKYPEKYKYLNDMIEIEKSDPRMYAVDALLWLKRAHEFASGFYRGIISEWRSGSTEQSVTHVLVAVYERVLKKYHNWFVQNFFEMLLKTFPSRKEFVKVFYYGKDGPEKEALDAAEIFVNELDSNIEVIVKMYDEWGLDVPNTLNRVEPVT